MGGNDLFGFETMQAAIRSVFLKKTTFVILPSTRKNGALFEQEALVDQCRPAAMA